MEKGEKAEKEQEKRQEKKEKKKAVSFFQVGSFLLLIALIIIVLIVVQVPYTTTNAVKENVLVEKCTEKDVPFSAIFRTGLTYENSLKVHSSDGVAFYRYSDLKPSVFANIKNLGEERGIFCIDVETYLLSDFNFSNNEEAFVLFDSLLTADSDRVQKLDNESSPKYTYPICTEKSISPVNPGIISLWKSNIISKDIQEQYNLDDVYVLLSVMPPTFEECGTEYEEKTNEEEVTRYCNAWKHLVGRC